MATGAVLQQNAKSVDYFGDMTTSTAAAAAAAPVRKVGGSSGGATALASRADHVEACKVNEVMHRLFEFEPEKLDELLSKLRVGARLWLLIGWTMLGWLVAWLGGCLVGWLVDALLRVGALFWFIVWLGGGWSFG